MKNETEPAIAKRLQWNSTEEELVVHRITWIVINAALTFDFYELFSDVLSRVLLLVITGVVVISCYQRPLRGTVEHAVYSTVGLFFFVGEAQLLMCHSCWYAGTAPRRYLHGLLGTFAVWIGLLGIISKTMNKMQENKRRLIEEQSRNFSSKHSRTGVAGYVFILLCALTGMVLTFVSKLYLHMCHRIFGLLGFVSLGCSLWLSFNTVFARRKWKIRWIKVLKVATIGGTFFVAYGEIAWLTKDITTLIASKWLSDETETNTKL